MTPAKANGLRMELVMRVATRALTRGLEVMNDKQTLRKLQERQATSLALTSSANSLKAMSSHIRLSFQSNLEVRIRVLTVSRLYVSTKKLS